MEKPFAFLSVPFFTRAEIYPGSMGTFRYRFQRSGWMNNGTIQAWVYENISFELAQDVESMTVPWTEEGIDSLRGWLNEKLQQRGTQPYFIP